MFTTMNSLINRLKSALAFLDLACEPPLQASQWKSRTIHALKRKYIALRATAMSGS